MRDRYIRAKVLVTQGKTVKQACNSSGLSERIYLDYEKTDKKFANFYEGQFFRKIFILFVIMVSMSLIFLAFALS